MPVSFGSVAGLTRCARRRRFNSLPHERFPVEQSVFSFRAAPDQSHDFDAEGGLVELDGADLLLVVVLSEEGEQVLKLHN